MTWLCHVLADMAPQADSGKCYHNAVADGWRRRTAE